MVPTSAEDATPATRGQPTRLSRNYQRGNGGKFWRKVIVICFDFQKTLHAETQRCFLHSQPLFCLSGLSFELCWFGWQFGKHAL